MGPKCKNEKSYHNASSRRDSTRPSPFSFSIQVDYMQWILTIISFVTRFWRLNYPHSAVFDEVHFGRSAAMYLNRTFHFDTHPPLGNMLVALSAHSAGFDGDIQFDRIGTEFKDDTPVWLMRVLPAFMGSLIAPVAYQIMVEMKFSYWTAMLASSLIILDNALLVQSRFILMEGMLIFFISTTIMLYLKAKNEYVKNTCSRKWVFWMVCMSISGTCTLSIRYIGLCTVAIVFFLSAKEFWDRLSQATLTTMQIFGHLSTLFAVIVILPIILYVSIFYVHLSILTKAGPHDTVLTSAFQASLEGGLASITKGQPLEVAYGSQITLRHTYGTPCWLHSHNQLYPLRYNDRRGSSHQQQVTCYHFKDVNNWWIVKDPTSHSLIVDDPKRPVQDGDVFQLVHGMTGRTLNSHDVAAPVSPQHQEVSGYVDHNVSHSAQNLWRLEIINKDTFGPYWKTIQSQTRLLHVNTSQALKASGKQLPEWGFHQLEVVTDRDKNQEAAVWNVEEHRYSKNTDGNKTKMELEEAEMIPLQPTYMSFYAKFIELQKKMLTSTADSHMEHQFSSAPLEWPLLQSNVAYWVRPQDYAQVHLIGNPIIWYSGVMCTLFYIGILVIILMRRQRQIYDICDDLWDQYTNCGGILLAGYILHYVPYFLMDRTLFLYLYLPSLFFQILLMAVVMEHIYHLISWQPMKSTHIMLVIAWMTSAVHAFFTFSVISYGFSPPSEEDLEKLKWQETWSFLEKIR